MRFEYEDSPACKNKLKKEKNTLAYHDRVCHEFIVVYLPRERSVRNMM